MTKKVKEVLDPLRKKFKECPRCNSSTIIFTVKKFRAGGFRGSVADLVRCPRYLGGCGWKMTKDECVEVHGDER